jgi:hypothetical protein
VAGAEADRELQQEEQACAALMSLALSPVGCSRLDKAGLQMLSSSQSATYPTTQFDTQEREQLGDYLGIEQHLDMGGGSVIGVGQTQLAKGICTRGVHSAVL